MAIKKSELYSSLWASCDELRGGMDASQYKDYVLVLLFIKYVSDKYADVPYAPITIPEGASFKDMVELKGKTDIGDQINKKIIGPLVKENKQLSDMPDFNDASKLGSGKEMVERLTNLITIFEDEALDFSKNRAGGDDILGDAYEYLMRHFASESGKSKGQFYTPAEVSRVMAQILGIREDKTTSSTSVYDPTCGSGSLLLKVADEASSQVTLYGQEKDASNAGLARMNMILHDNPTALIKQANTLTNPLFKDGDSLKTFDYVVANPPFSDKRWSTGLDPERDPYERFKSFGIPPKKQGDYAYLLHIVRSLRSRGKGACILPHGVLFRGNTEAEIRRNLIRKGYIKGIIGLPTNMFYGTGIPACIVVIDKVDAQARKGVFMIDASHGFIKDGAKNRLRAQDIHKIVDVFNRQLEVPKYSRMVGFDEIEKHEFNLNLPRYIDSQEPEDIQDIEGHLYGGIPTTDIEALGEYWEICSQLEQALFKANRQDYLDLAVDKDAIKPTIYEHPEFVAFREQMSEHFFSWRQRLSGELKELETGFSPKELVAVVSENLLAHYKEQPLLDCYDIYQHFMDYWDETMQDDCYWIAAEGWKAKTYRVMKPVKSGKKKGELVDKGWACDLVPKIFIIGRYYAVEQEALDYQEAALEKLETQLSALEEEHGHDEGALHSVSKKSDAEAAWNKEMDQVWEELMPEAYRAYRDAVSNLKMNISRLSEMQDDPLVENLRNNKGNITKANVKSRLKMTADENEKRVFNEYLVVSDNIRDTKKTIKDSQESANEIVTKRLGEEEEDEEFDDLRAIKMYLDFTQQISELKSAIKKAKEELDALAYAKYPTLSEEEIKTLAVDDKWMTALEASVDGEVDWISQALTQRVKALTERYETPLPQMVNNVNELEARVNQHLEKMGFTWA